MQPLELLSIVTFFYCIFLHLQINHLKEGGPREARAAADLPSPTPSRETRVRRAKEAPSFFSQVLDWFKEDWYMKLGAFLILLGFAWLTTYAFMEDWIGPIGRITMGIVGGLLILVAGDWRMKKSIPQGSVLVALGGSTIILTLFAARFVYDFFTPLSVLIFMAAVVAFMAFYSVKYRVAALAVLGLLIGGLVPILTDGDASLIGLFSYLLVLCAGILWVVGLTGWRFLAPIALIILSLYSFARIEFGLSQAEHLTAILFAYAFAVLFFATNMASILKNKRAQVSDLFTAGANGLLLLYWISAAIPEEWRSLITAATMLFFFVGAYSLFKATSLKETVYVYGGVAFILLVAATSFELSGANLTLAYTAEAALMIAGGQLLMKDPKVVRWLSLLLLPSIWLGLRSIDALDTSEALFTIDFALIVSIILVTLGLGTYLQRYKQAISTLFFTVGGFYAMTLVWISTHHLIDSPSMKVMAALTFYTVAGMILNVRGKRVAGGILIALVVGRLLLVDVWDMAITGRIVTFFVIGFLLLSTAFLGKKLPSNKR